MVTKDEERKALDQIKKIIEKLGDDSYIAIAFEGCFDIAEENINNDFACSMEQKYNNEHEQVVLLLKKISEYHDEFVDIDKKVTALEKEIETKDQLLEHERSMKRELDKELVFADSEIEKQSAIIEKLNDVVERQDAEIIKLKARLYDLICEQ